jgi:hypothetical protein
VFDENDRVVVVVVATNEEHVTVPLILRFRSRVKYGDCIYPFVCIKVTQNASDQKIRKTSETHRRNSSLATTRATTRRRRMRRKRTIFAEMRIFAAFPLFLLLLKSSLRVVKAMHIEAECSGCRAVAVRVSCLSFDSVSSYSSSSSRF